LRRRIGTCRAVYNVALVQRAQFWRAFKRIEDAHISFASQCEELTALRARIRLDRGPPDHAAAAGAARPAERLQELLHWKGAVTSAKSVEELRRSREAARA